MAITVREATTSDCDLVVGLAREFLTHTAYGQLFGPVAGSRLETFFHVLLAIGVIFVGEQDGEVVGALALADVEHPVTGVRYAEELMWWVTPSARGTSVALRLLGAGERWTRQNGLSVLKMVAPEGERSRLSRLYQRRGYTPVETSWQRGFS